MYYPREHIKAVEKRLAFYEKLMKIRCVEEFRPEPCGICGTVNIEKLPEGSPRCRGCLISVPECSITGCVTEARQGLGRFFEKIYLEQSLDNPKEALKRVRKLAKIRYQELLANLERHGYEYK